MPILDRRQPYASEEGPEVKHASSRDEEELSPEEASTSNDEEETDAEETKETTEDETSEESSEESKEEESEGSTDEEEESELEREQAAVQAITEVKKNLLKEIEDLRVVRRQERTGQTDKPLVIEKPGNQADELGDLEPATVETIERVLKAKGYVRKEEISANDYHRDLKSQQDIWLEAHPEYKPENDPNDEKWNALTAITSMFAPPKTPKDIQRILSMAHRELNPTGALPTKSRGEIAAKNEKLKVSSKTGGGSGTKAAAPAKKAPNLSGLIGFSDEELAEFAS